MKVHNSTLYFILFLFLTTSVIYSQSDNEFQFPITSNGPLKFDVDIYKYEGRRDKAVLEVAYAIDISEINKYSGEIPPKTAFTIDIKISDSTNKIINSIHEKQSVIPAKIKNLNQYSFIDLRRFAIMPGTVNIHMTIDDSVSGLQGSINNNIKLRPNRQSFSISDPEFVSFVEKAESSNNFEKQGLNLIPNPSREFWVESGQEKCYVYYEVNNLSYNEENPSYYRTRYSISDLSNREIIQKSDDAILKKSSNTARLEVVDLENLKTGIYKFSLTVKDLKTEESIGLSRYFWVYALDSAGLALPMTDADIEKYYNQIRYIATDQEKKVYRKLDKQGKQRFLLEFWRKRDPNSQTPENEFMEEYFRRIAYVEENFSEGIKSDRARIFLTYGSPLDVQRYPSKADIGKPVEIWTYGFDGNTEFVFVDRTRDGAFVLIHSNHPDEYNNPDWKDDEVY